MRTSENEIRVFDGWVALVTLISAGLLLGIVEIGTVVRPVVLALYTALTTVFSAYCLHGRGKRKRS